MVGQQVTRRGQLPGSSLDQLDAKIGFEIGNVLGHCGLADAQIFGCPDERPSSHEGSESPHTRPKLHKWSLYEFA
jgi:hypothetical protein